MLTVVVVLVAVVLVTVGFVGIACSAAGSRAERVPPHAQIAFVPEGVLLICDRCSTVSGPFPMSSELTASDLACDCSGAPGGASREGAA